MEEIPEGQPVKRLKAQIHGAKQEKLYPEEARRIGAVGSSLGTFTCTSGIFSMCHLFWLPSFWIIYIKSCSRTWTYDVSA